MLSAMTTTTTPPAARPPGRIWYLLAVLIAIAGWIGMVMVLVAGLSGSTDRMMRILAPGQSELALDESGTYTIFHEYRSILNGRVYNVDSVSGLQVVVREKASGATLALSSTTGSNYSVGSYHGRSLFSFEARKPGVYLLSASYDDGRKQPQTVLAIARGFVGALIGTILGALASAFGGMALAITLFIVVFIKRKRARQATAPVTSR
jgi:hypothetical protein